MSRRKPLPAQRKRFVIRSVTSAGYYVAYTNGETIEGVPVLVETHNFGTRWGLIKHLKSVQSLPEESA